MALLADRSSEPNHDHFFCLAISEVGPDQRHCGIIYRPKVDELRILHLAFHYLLQDEILDDSYRWASTGLDQTNQKVLAAFAMCIASADPQIPYAFNDEGVALDPSTGNISRVPLGHGLTCATFVLAVMKAYGYDLLDRSSWHDRPEDAAWRQSITTRMEDFIARRGGDQSHVEAVQNSESARRIRPEEVVGAATTDQVEWPVSFPRAEALSQEIIRDLAA